MFMKFVKIAGTIVFFLIIGACKSNNHTETTIALDNTTNQEIKDTAWIEKYKGILIYNYEYDYNININEDIIILNSLVENPLVFVINFGKEYIKVDGNTFSFSEVYEEDFVKKYGFSPKMFEVSPTFLHCYVTGQNEDYYFLNIGERPGFISKKDNRFTFLTIEEYLSKYVIGTDLKTNPIRISPDDSTKIIEIDNDLDWCFDVLEIKGDWMKVQSFNMCYIIEETKFKEFQGWIKFRENGQLLINQYLSC